jgi:ankyrin repeat protein
MLMYKLLDNIVESFDISRETVGRLLLVDSSVLLIENKNNGNNLLINACFNNKHDLVKIILNSKFCTDKIITHRNQNGRNALMVACSSSEECAAEILKSKFCNTKLLEEVDPTGENCLTISFNIPSIIKHIIESPYFSKKVLSQKYNGTNVLMGACQEEDSDDELIVPDEVMVSLLTHKFCDRNILEDQDNNGCNILHCAAYCRPSIIKLLLELDFDHNRTCKEISDFLPSHFKQFIDDNDEMEIGFTYLHILAIYNPDYIDGIVRVAKSNTIMMRDNLGRYFYDYLDDAHKIKLNALDCFKPKIVVFAKGIKVTCSICYDKAVDTVSIPCGHTFCSKCLNAVRQQNSKCPICKSTILQANRLFLP